MRLPVAIGALVVVAALRVAGQDQPWQPMPLPRQTDPAPAPVCEPPAPDGRVRTATVADGRIYSFRQEPTWLSARDDQGVRLREFVVAGDVDRVRFERWDDETRDYVAETWTRERSDTIGGRVVSIFEPSWPASIVQSRLSRARVGLDAPSLWLGYFRGPADAPSVYQGIRVRVASSTFGTTEVVRLDDTAQYASHVVNLVIPGFGDSRLNGEFDLTAIARKFYEHFEDSYDILAVVPADLHLDSTASAYHQRVKNDVDGLGLARFDRAADYGSAGRLRGVEVFYGTTFGLNDTSSHELAHTWGHNFDWTRIAGITRAGHQPVSHTPLMTGGESLVGGVLDVSRRVTVRADDSAVIERSPVPAIHHPLDLYAMGLLSPADLGTFVLFDEQGQFSATSTSTPAPGTPVNGGRKTISINDVMAAHGTRSGPVLSELRRATIVVTRDGLLAASDLAGWNLLAARQEDRAGTGVIDYDGVGSFDAATNRRIDLSTDIRPLAAGPLPRTQDPEPPRFGAVDCRGFEFTTPPPTRVRAGQRFTVAGRVTARDRSDFYQALFRFWPADDDRAKEELAYAAVSRSGQFSVDVEIRPGREGQYAFDGFLFWEGAAPQAPRCQLSVLTVTR